MSAFERRLAAEGPDPAGRSWIFVPYDQLTDRIGPLAGEPPGQVGVVLVENRWKASLRPYHKQKLALIVANLRHFALEQAARGVAVRHVAVTTPYREALRPLAHELGPLTMMEPAERELRADLEPLIADGRLRVVPHEGWLTTEEQFEAAGPDGGPWRMDSFYRRVRADTGILMEGDSPAGGKYSFDAENREPWPGEPAAPDAPTFPRDPIKEEVVELVESEFGAHPGRVDVDRLPATSRDAEALWEWAKREALPLFGPYEDAMSTRSSGLFHTRISPLLNLHRLLPRRVVDEAAALDVPLASKEGFIRQVLGWREFVRHVHRATDGLRELPDGRAPTRQAPGDGGYASWSDGAWRPGTAAGWLDGGAQPEWSRRAERAPLPSAYWGDRSGLDCLDTVVSDVWKEGWSHHITRLMVLANIATLLDVDPRALTDWFWVAYIDAFDWVVEPNVLGMGTFASGPAMTTKPYVSGSNYISKMSDYCEGCAFDPARDCPLRSLYWAFLDRHSEALAENPRMRLPLASLSRRSEERRSADREVFERVGAALAEGRRLRPGADGL